MIAQDLARSLIVFIDIAFKIIYFMLILRIVLTWVGVNPHTHYNELLGVLFQVRLTPLNNEKGIVR